MKSKAVDAKMSDEVFESIEAAVGKGKLKECEGTLVLTPSNTEELAKTVGIIMENGGSVAPLSLKGKHVDVDVYVDMSEMNSIVKFDPVAMTVRVQVGCKISDLNDVITEKGFFLGAYPAGSDSTVEDWVYKEEAGVGSFKYGTVKDSVYNIIAVDPFGKVLETGYDKIGYYMSGYNLIQTLAASNGKLAIISEVTLKVYPAGVVKGAAYELPDASALQAAFMKIAQEPSVKPYHISFCGKKAVIGFQGDEAVVDMDIDAVNAIMTDVGATIVDGNAAWQGIEDCDCVNPKLPTNYIPLKNLAAFIDGCKGIASFEIKGNVPDMSTAAVKLVGDVGKDAYCAAVAKAEELGGRSSCRCHSTYRGEGAKKLMKRIEDGFYGVPAEEVKFNRKVTPEFIDKLREAIGAKNVNVSSVDRIIYSHDLAPLPKEAGLAFNNIPDVIARPNSVEHISAVMSLAYRYGIPVTPRGNASWGLGGCMPTFGGVILDMTSVMNRVIEINTEELYVKVEAGCTWKKLLEACMKKGYIVGSYPSSFPSGTVGAWISTNGMGIGSYKYGSAKDNIINAEIVLDDGTVVETGFQGTESYRAMYNLNQFFSGAEGTLGMLGTVTFRIYPMGEIRCLAYEFDALKQMNEPIQEVVNSASTIPLHVAWSDYIHFENQRKAGVHAPDVTNLWLVTLQGDAAHNDYDEAQIDAIAEKHGGRKVAGEIAEHEWEERCYEFRARKVGVGEIPAEVVVPTKDWGTFTDECYCGFEAMKMEAGGVIGVMVDRSTTLFMPYYFKEDEIITGMLSFGFNFYMGDQAALYGGRTTGLGVFFAWMLDVIHDIPTAEKMRQLKTAMDGHDVVNPGHVTCGSTKFGINLNKDIMGLGSWFMQFAKKIMPADKTFEANRKRFRYDDLEHMKVLDRVHTLGDGTQ
ncbi:MAG: FAD-binding oxidoreductase [Candidatus Methanomethylophilaceae archaeon]|nr:FAD-binding oxidoreductase [Candidatus Methanomethylophilaceae archaeon]